MSLSTIIENFKSVLISLIVAAENSIEGTTGKEKRATVIAQLDEAFEFDSTILEKLDNFLFAIAVNFVCDRLNLLTDDDFAGLTEEQQTVIADTLDVDTSEIEEICETAMTVDERLDILYKKYGIKSEDKETSGDDE